MSNRKQEQSLLEKLSYKYRMVVMNDDTLEEQWSFRLSQLNMYISFSTLVIILVIIITTLIVFTPLKEYIPGYGDTNMRRQLVEISYATDSLEEVIVKQDAYINNIRSILIDSVDLPIPAKSDLSKELVIEDEVDTTKTQVPIEEVSEVEKDLREEIERQENYALLNKKEGSTKMSSIADLHFMPPLKGMINDGFNVNKNHLGVDVLASEHEPIKAVADGVVIVDNWTVEDGYVIGIQHANNTLSFYKHNSVLLKKVGNFVKAGDVIAVIGDSGEETTGPHLHFELWYNQVPVDPTNYITFE